ncbi:MAG: MerR family transcriptional regulator [Lachnospiraceae bacterium]|nr:MerR family transcriptional regulator [Lachnospiraceae bacterium]
MVFFDNRKLFTSAEVCHACGISKTSLFRLEECGFLKPYHVNPDTGYRYYDLQNITSIGQFQKMQAIGLSKKEIVELYYERVDSSEFLAAQRQKLNMMQRFLDGYEKHHSHTQNQSGSFITLPPISCYCENIAASSPEDAAKLDYLTHEKCVEAGYKMLGSEPLFGIFEERNAWEKCEGAKIKYTLCIPVIPDPEPDPKIRFFPETRGFSMIGFGEYSSVKKFEKVFWKEVDKRNLSPSSSVRMIMHIGAYSGAHYKTACYCYEYFLPMS